MNENKKTKIHNDPIESTFSIPEDEIDLLDLFRTLVQAWKLIASTTVIGLVLAGVYGMRSPDLYKAEVLLAPAEEDNARMSSPVDHFGGLANLAGITVPGDSNIERVLATMQSREFLKSYVEKSNLLPQIFPELWDQEKNAWILEPGQAEPTVEDGYWVFQDTLTVNADKQSGLITLDVLWANPEVVAQWANNLVRQLNEELREKAKQDSIKRIGYLKKELAETTLKDMRQVLYSILESEKQKSMLANVNEDFALEIIDPAYTPKAPVKPNRKLIIVVGGVCGSFLGVFMVFALQFVNRLKSTGHQKRESEA